MAITVGTGITITFATGFLAEIVGVKWGGIERGALDGTHQGTATARVFSPSNLYDPGELEIQIHHIPATMPPIGAAAGAVTVTFPGGKQWQLASGFMTAYAIDAMLEDKILATARVKLSGAITIV